MDDQYVHSKKIQIIGLFSVKIPSIINTQDQDLTILWTNRVTSSRHAERKMSIHDQQNGYIKKLYYGMLIFLHSIRIDSRRATCNVCTVVGKAGDSKGRQNKTARQ